MLLACSLHNCLTVHVARFLLIGTLPVARVLAAGYPTNGTACLLKSVCQSPCCPPEETAVLLADSLAGRIQRLAQRCLHGLSITERVDRRLSSGARLVVRSCASHHNESRCSGSRRSAVSTSAGSLWSRGFQSTYLLPQGRQPLLLGVSVDVRPNDKAHDIEERHPRLLREELLRKCQCDGAGNP